MTGRLATFLFLVLAGMKGASAGYAPRLLLAGECLNRGNICFLMGDWDRALLDYRMALLSLTDLPGNARLKCEVLSNMGAVYLKLGEAEHAMRYFDSASVYTGTTSGVLFRSRLKLNRGMAFMALSMPDSAVPCFTAILENNGEVVHIGLRERVIALKNLALISAGKKDTGSAIEILQKAISVAGKGSLTMEKSDLLLQMGDLEVSAGRADKALESYSTALKMVGRIPDTVGFRCNPAVLQLTFRLLAGSGRAWLAKRGSAEGDTHCLRMAIRYLEKAEQCRRKLTDKNRSGISRMHFTKYCMDFLQACMEAYHGMNADGDTGYLGRLYETAEEGRACEHTTRLLRRLQRDPSATISLPEIRIRAIDRELDCLNMDLLGVTGREETFRGDELKVQLLKMMSLQTARDSLEKVISGEMHRNGDADVNRPVPVRKVCDLLDPDEAVLEYFTGDTVLFILVFKREGLNVVRVRLPPGFNDMATRFSGRLGQADVSGWVKESFHLYDYLVGPADTLLKRIQKLVIIPDHALAMIPYEVLSPGPGSGGKSMNYLISRYSVRYHNSVSLWYLASIAGRRDSVRDFAGFAPVFKETCDPGPDRIPRSFPDPLPFSQEEITRIGSLMDKTDFRGKVYIGQEATRERFLRESEISGYLQVATHAFLDPASEFRSGLLFDSGMDSASRSSCRILTVGEIRNLYVPGELVVLSACGTGKVENFPMKGAMSLSDSFLMAGAKNIVCTLWNVNDRLTCDFMVGFYRWLAQGADYAEAMRREKLRMLADESTSLPFMWAGYRLIGP